MLKTKLKKIKSLINMWSSRCLSLIGKITILKSIVMPHILHNASVMYLGWNIVKSLDELFFNFLWSIRKHGISKKVVIQPIEFAGIKMIIIESMIKSFEILWFKRLFNNVDAKWKHLSWYLLGVSKSNCSQSKVLEMVVKYNFINKF